jgi:hypothetical protein
MDISAWLNQLGLPQYAAAFHDQAIDAEILPKLTAEDLKEIGVAALGHRKKLLDAIARLKEAPVDPFAVPNRPREAEWRQLLIRLG